MSIFKEALNEIKRRRDRIISGKINCIPFNLPRFAKVVSGIEQGRYYLISANTKVGKSQFTDWFFIMQPIIILWQAYLQGTDPGFKLHISFFSLEMNPTDKMLQVISNFIYRNTSDNKRLDIKKLKSTDAALHEGALKFIEDNAAFFEFLESHITYVNNVRTVESYKTYVQTYFSKRGSVKTTASGTKYTATDPDVYEMFIWDHASLTDTTKMYPSKQMAIKALSNYNIQVRNTYNGIPILIQQQSALSESIESIKFRKGEPTLEALEYNKSTAFDVDYVFGLYSPARYNIAEYYGYDITKLKDNFRVLKILAGRWGGIGDWTGVYFDGAVNHFTELPKPQDTRINVFYNKQL